MKELFIMPQDNTNGITFDLQLFAEEGVGDAGAVTDAGDSTVDSGGAGDNGADGAGSDDAIKQDSEQHKDGESQKDGGEQGSKEVTDLLADYKPTMPDGFEINDQLMGEFVTIAKEYGINPEQADKMVGLGCQVAKNAVESWTNAINDQAQKNYADFMQSQGKNVEQDVGNINSLLDKYGGKDATEAFHAALTALSVYGNDAMKPLFTALQKMGKDFADPDFHFGQQAPKETNFYPDVPKGSKFR